MPCFPPSSLSFFNISNGLIGVLLIAQASPDLKSIDISSGLSGASYGETDLE